MQQRYCQTSRLAKEKKTEQIRSVAVYTFTSSIFFYLLEFRLLLEFGSVMESWAFLGFRTHWQHVYSAISRERRTALRCKEWCFDVSTSFFPNKVFCLVRDITPLQFRLRMFQKSRKHPHLMTLQLVFTYFHGWRFQLPWFLDTWRPAWFLNRACALETDSHFGVPSGKMSATGEAVSSLHACKTNLALDFLEKIWLWRCQPCWKNGDINHPNRHHCCSIFHHMSVLYWLPGRQVERWI